MDESSELCGEALVGRQAGRVLLDHLCQHLKLRLAVLVRELAGSELDQCDAEAPDVGPDVVVRLVGVGRVDSLGGHVGGTAGTPGLGLRVNESAWGTRNWKKL